MSAPVEDAALRILVVEDDQQSGRALTRLLELLNHRVEWVTTLADGLAKLDGQQVVILDLHLPDGSGLELLEKVRNEGRTAKVFILSAADNVELRKINRADVDGVFRKPVDLVELISHLK